MKPSTGIAASFEREYYEANYRNYHLQNPLRKLRHYREAVESALPGCERIQVLDIGCSFGTFLGSLDERWDAYGIDVSEYAIRLARQAVPGARFDNVHDGKIPFDVQFTAITAWDVIEHVPDLDAFANEVNSHLVERGAFVFVVPVYDGPLGPVVRVLDHDPTHIHKRPRQFWLDWATHHFRVETWWGIFRYLLPGGYYAHWPTRRLRRLAPAVAVVGRRSSL